MKPFFSIIGILCLIFALVAFSQPSLNALGFVLLGASGVIFLARSYFFRTIQDEEIEPYQPGDF